jgi:hypothetical protein
MREPIDRLSFVEKKHQRIGTRSFIASQTPRSFSQKLNPEEPDTGDIVMQKKALDRAALEKVCLDELRSAPGYETLERIEVRAIPRDRHDRTWQLARVHPDHSVGRKWAPLKMKLTELQQTFDLVDA